MALAHGTPEQQAAMAAEVAGELKRAKKAVAAAGGGGEGARLNDSLRHALFTISRHRPKRRWNNFIPINCNPSSCRN